MKSSKIECIFFLQSIKLADFDVKKFSKVVPNISSPEECYEIMVAIENLRDDLNNLEEKIKKESVVTAIKH